MGLEISAAVATVRSLAAVVKEAGKIELHQKVLELQQVLLEAVTQNTELAEKNHVLSERVRILESQLAEKGASETLRFDGQVYWQGEVGEQDNGPICPKCKDGHDRVSRMADRGNGYTCCPVCDYCLPNASLPYPKLRLSREYDGNDDEHGNAWI